MSKEFSDMDHSTDWVIERFVRKQFYDPRNTACAKGFTIFSVLSYLYCVTNDLNNHDNVTVFESGYNGGVSLGRWFLQVIGDWLEKWDMTYNIPYFNIVVGLIFLLLSTILAIHILHIADTRLCFALGSITASFSVVAATMFYSYTVQFYFFAILLGTLGVHFAIKKRWYSIVSPVLFSLSLGIYQAYYPFVAALLVLALIQETLNDDIDWKTVLKDSFLYLFLLLLGYFLYMGLNQLVLNLYQVTLEGYQGISSMGQLTIRELITQVKKSYLDYGLLFTNGYHGISLTAVIKIALIANFGFVLLFVILEWKGRALLKNLELCVLLLLLPLAANAIVIMVPYGFLHVLMLYGLLSLFYLPLLMAQNLKLSALYRKIAILFVCLTTILSSLSYTYQNNGNYRSMYYKNRKMENYYAMLLGQARAVEGFHEDMEIVLTNHQFPDNSLNDNLNQRILRYDVVNPSLQFALEAESWHTFIYQYFGYITRDATTEELSKYASIIDEMDRYPNSGSIRIIDDKVFVKCGEN